MQMQSVSTHPYIPNPEATYSVDQGGCNFPQPYPPSPDWIIIQGVFMTGDSGGETELILIIWGIPTTLLQEVTKTDKAFSIAVELCLIEVPLSNSLDYTRTWA